MTNCEKKANKALRALWRFFLYAFSGALTALPIAIPSLWFFGWVAPAPVLYLEFTKKEKKDSYIRAYGRGMSFFWFFGAVVFYWFRELYPLDFLGFGKNEALITVLLATIGIPLLQAIVWAFVFVGICFLRRRGTADDHPILTSVFTSALFVICEFCHTLTWAGVPWGRFAVGQTGFLPIVQSASLFGSYFITFIMVFVASLLAFCAREAFQKNTKKSIIFGALAAAVFISNLAFGAVKLALPEESGEDVCVAAIQGNIRFEDKWSDKEGHTMGVYRDLSLSAANDGADLILWPETAIPYNFTNNFRLNDYYKSLGIEAGCELIVTSFESEGADLYNTARLLSPDGSLSDTVYKKRHLVPFGEYTPLEEFIAAVFPPLAEMSALSAPLSPGDSTAVTKTQNGYVGSLICFDSIYESLCRESVLDGAELICISTNDSWFSGSAALSQHNAQAQLRAIENGRYILRSANTGISSVISPKGEILDSVGDGEQGYAFANIRFIDDNTLYTAIGNSFIFLCLAFAVAFAVYSTIENRKREKRI